MKSRRFYELAHASWCPHRGIFERFAVIKNKELDAFLKTAIKVVNVTQGSGFNNGLFVNSFTVWYDDAETNPRAFQHEPVSTIEWSSRVSKVLFNARITTLGQLASKTEGEMLEYRNFKDKSLQEVKDKLATRGLTLGMKFD